VEADKEEEKSVEPSCTALRKHAARDEEEQPSAPRTKKTGNASHPSAPKEVEGELKKKQNHKLGGGNDNISGELYGGSTTDLKASCRLLSLALLDYYLLK
jgi:hypothetical protein